MDRIKSAKHIAAFSIVLPAVAMLVWPSSVWLLVLFMLWFAAAAAIWICSERREHKKQLALTIHSLQAAGMRTLNHHRHDWMNDLQVLYGYTRMQKPDKTVEYVEKIRAKMLTESQISKLGEPALVSYIQGFRTLTSSLELKVDIEQDLNLVELPLAGTEIAEALIGIMNGYRLAVKPGFGEVAVLTLALDWDGQQLHVAFDLEGELIDEQQLKDQIKQQLKGATLQAVDIEHPQEEIRLKAEKRA
ncbi:Spo0B domain-containing protein [Paenibacillus algorifonticola]|uniref:Spo0B domain-containing protein n=1 Tax=Paenibacillus algorifonticola TaxID=684063 RepID=UPI003D264F41